MTLLDNELHGHFKAKNEQGVRADLLPFTHLVLDTRKASVLYSRCLHSLPNPYRCVV